MIDELLRDLHAKYLPCEDGEVRDLGRGRASDFGLAATSVDGTQWATGDCDKEFTLQSITKPLVYAAVLGLLGEEKVSERVDVEPIREPYNAIELEEGSGRPANAMLNSGGITTAGLMREAFGEGAWERIHGAISAAAGRPLAVDEEVYRSHLRTAHRNRAIAYLLRSQGVLKDDPDAAVDLFDRQCSILLTCRDLSAIGATLANVGTNPLTGEKVFEPQAVQDTLSVMLTCGMYNSSGDWVFRVGIPAKSGVGGGLLGIVNRQVGIATYSPPLDPEGHSVRGMTAFADLSARCSLHAFHQRNHGSNFLHDEFGD
ncbi:hypothetical protein BH23VER1_BH23VER1_19590 [soil metagenome]